MASAHDPNELRKRLFHEIKKRRTGMLGLVGAEHMQPMTAFCEEDGGPIWFYCRKENDLVSQSAGGKPAMLCLVTGDDSFIACVGGTLQADHDKERIERFWNPVAGAWFPEGKDDPNLTSAAPRSGRRPGLGQPFQPAAVRLRDRQGERHQDRARRGRHRPPVALADEARSPAQGTRPPSRAL